MSLEVRVSNLTPPSQVAAGDQRLSRCPPPPWETWALRSAATAPTPSAGFPRVGAPPDMSSSFLIQGSSGPA